MAAPSTQLQYTRFNDFRPGIVNRSQHALGGVGLPAPLGAAQEANTYRCFALPTGGLAPLPRRNDQMAVNASEGTQPQSGYWVVGFLAHGPMSAFVGGVSRYADQLFVAVAYQLAAGNIQRYRLFRVQVFDSGTATVDTIRVLNTAYSDFNYYESAWLATSRVNDADPTKAGNPVIMHSWATPGGSDAKTIDLFPNPAAPNVTAMVNLSTARWGQLYGHQGRIVLNEVSLYSLGDIGGSFTEEQISFTDPPNSSVGTLGTQAEVFSQENPTGYGAFGSISAGELFLVKRNGGGIIVSGDIAFPTITRLPGVQSTGACVSNRAASTGAGLFYGVKNGGVYVWRGADTAQKISVSLEDTSFEHPDQAPRIDQTGYTNQQVISLENWGNWILGTNNWIYDMDTNAWFRIEDPSVVNCMFWSRSWSGQFMFGCIPKFSQSSLTCVYVWDRNLGATSWSWQSQPLYLTKQRLITVREIVLLAEGSGTVNITLTKIDGSTQTETFTVTATSFPQLLRLRTAAHGYTAVMRIESNGGSNPAPVVHSVDLGWEESTEATAA